MWRLCTVSAVAALTAVMMAVMAAPAMARDFNDNDLGFFGFGDDDLDFGFFDNNGSLGSDVDQESESGDIETNFDVSNTGDYASQCTPALQLGNTGNFNNGSSFVQFGSGDAEGLDDFDNFFGFGDEFDASPNDFEPGGINVSFEPVQNTNCSNTIQQSPAVNGGYYWG